MALDMRGLNMVPAKTDEEYNVQIEVSGTDDAAVNGFVAKACSYGSSTLTGEIVGLRGKAYLETSATLTNAAGCLTGVLGAIKVVGTHSTPNNGACVTGQVHEDSTGTIGSIFRAVDSGSGTVRAVLDCMSIQPTYIIKFITSTGARYGMSGDNILSVFTTNLTSNPA